MAAADAHPTLLTPFSGLAHAALSPVALAAGPRGGVQQIATRGGREELLREGAAGGITCVDLSPVAVQQMRDRLAAHGIHGVDIVVPDMLDLPFESESFDLVIEKGTMEQVHRRQPGRCPKLMIGCEVKDI